MLNAYLYEGLRTPFGRHAGTLAKVGDTHVPASNEVASQTAYLSPSLLAHSTGAANALEETRRAARAARHKLNFFIGKLLGQRPGDGNTSVPSGCRAWETYPLLYLRHPEGLTHGFGFSSQISELGLKPYATQMRELIHDQCK